MHFRKVIFLLGLSVGTLSAQNKYMFSAGLEYTYLVKNYYRTPEWHPNARLMPLQHQRFVKGLGYGFSFQTHILTRKRSSFYAGLSYRSYKNNYMDTFEGKSIKYYSNLIITEVVVEYTTISVGAMASYQYQLSEKFSFNMSLTAELAVKNKLYDQMRFSDNSTLTLRSNVNSIRLWFPYTIGMARQVYKTEKMGVYIEPYFRSAIISPGPELRFGLRQQFPSVGVRANLKF